MMTSSNGNIFRVTAFLCGEFNGHRWISLTKASDAEHWCYLWSAPWINGWVNNREAGDLWRHCAHYDVIDITIPTGITSDSLKNVFYMHNFLMMSFVLILGHACKGICVPTGERVLFIASNNTTAYNILDFCSISLDDYIMAIILWITCVLCSFHVGSFAKNGRWYEIYDFCEQSRRLWK